MLEKHRYYSLLPFCYFLGIAKSTNFSIFILIVEGLRRQLSSVHRKLIANGVSSFAFAFGIIEIKKCLKQFVIKQSF